jgi:hypothetical protein
MAKGKFNFKVFTSILLALAFVVMVVSGIILYISPPGRVANWTNWNIWGFSKIQWTNFHLTFMVVFIITGILHLFHFNWKQFWAYLKSRSQAGLRFKSEILAAAILFLILFIGTPLEIPPMSTVADLGAAFSDSWEENEIKSPLAHAELLTIEEYAATIKEPLDKVLAVFKKNGYEAAGPTQSLADLAAKYKVAPSDLDNLFRVETKEYESGARSSSGAGFGKMKLAEIAAKLNMTMDQALEKLRQAGVAQAEPDQTLKEIANANGLAPRDLMAVLDPGGEH